MATCPTCKNDRCGNHAACARKASVEKDVQKEADGLERFITTVANTTAQRLLSLSTELVGSDHGGELAWCVATKIEQGLRRFVPEAT